MVSNAAKAIDKRVASWFVIWMAALEIGIVQVFTQQSHSSAALTTLYIALASAGGVLAFIGIFSVLVKKSTLSYRYKFAFKRRWGAVCLGILGITMIVVSYSLIDRTLPYSPLPIAGQDSVDSDEIALRGLAVAASNEGIRVGINITNVADSPTILGPIQLHLYPDPSCYKKPDYTTPLGRPGPIYYLGSTIYAGEIENQFRGTITPDSGVMAGSDLPARLFLGAPCSDTDSRAGMTVIFSSDIVIEPDETVAFGFDLPKSIDVSYVKDVLKGAGMDGGQKSFSLEGYVPDAESSSSYGGYTVMVEAGPADAEASLTAQISNH